MTESVNVKKRRVKRGWVAYEVKEIKQETHDTKTFIFEDKDEGSYQFDYIAGQYLTFRYDGVAEKPVVRSYTMSSSPCQKENIAVTVKAVEGGLISNWMLNSLEKGSVLKARGPIGRFALDPNEKNTAVFMVAAGSGVTPFISIIREYIAFSKANNTNVTLSLLVSYRTTNDLISMQEIDEFRQFPGVKIDITLTREDKTSEGFLKGRIDETHLNNFFGGNYNNDFIYMTCGPDAVMDAMVAHLKANGVDESAILLESFES